MKVGFRHGDSRYPFLWESPDQSAGRWNRAGDGPVQYLADTPDGAWAEFLRHEEITDPADLVGVSRRIWVVELPADIDTAELVSVPVAISTGGLNTYGRCQAYAGERRKAGVTALRATSAALQPGAAGGQIVNGGLTEAPERDGTVWVLFGARPQLRGWAACAEGTPTERVLARVRHFSS